MSWIFGWWHPGAGTQRDVERAIARALPGASANIVCVGDRFLGAGIEHAGRTTGIASDEGSITLADARLDALGDADLGNVTGDLAARVFATDLTPDDVDLMDQLAGDFAVAVYQIAADRLLLTRDLCGSRPLYWMPVGDGIAFGSSLGFLSAITPAALETETCAASLAGLEVEPGTTGVRGVRTVPGGHVLAFSEEGIRRRRWFQPEADPVSARIDDAAVASVGTAIRAAVRARASASPVGVMLSGGRDSGSIAVALAMEGVIADCFTMTFDPSLCDSEDAPARALAEGLGHRWTAVPQSPDVIRGDQEWLAHLLPLPIGYPFGTSARQTHDVIVGRGTRTILEGTGGELFVASPHATLDLLRRGRIGAAFRSTRAFKHRWVYGYRSQMKIAAMATAPRSIQQLRRRRASRPPWSARWLPEAPRATDHERTAREHRLRFVEAQGTREDLGRLDMVGFPAGYRTSYPFFDRRVIRAALSLSAEDLFPDPEPKWVLERALLGDWTRSRVKASQEGWFREVARRARRSIPAAYAPDGHLASMRLIDPDGARMVPDPRWEVQSAALAWMEVTAAQFADDA